MSKQAPTPPIAGRIGRSDSKSMGTARFDAVGGRSGPRPPPGSALVGEPAFDLAGYRVPIGHRQVGGHRDVELGAHPVPEPAGPHLRHLLHALDVARRVPDLFHYVGLGTVEEARKDGLARLPDDPEDADGDDEAYDQAGFGLLRARMLAASTLPPDRSELRMRCFTKNATEPRFYGEVSRLTTKFTPRRSSSSS